MGGTARSISPAKNIDVSAEAMISKLIVCIQGSNNTASIKADPQIVLQNTARKIVETRR